MFFNYLKSAFRNLWKNRKLSVINVIGLSIGVTAVILILLYLQYEWSFDRFHKNGDSLYRISVLWDWEGRQEESLQFLAPVGPALKTDYPQVKQFLRLRGPVSEYFYQDKPIKLEKSMHVDSSFFDLLSFELLSGEPKSVLTEPYSMVLTQSMAQNIFGQENSVGKILQSGNGNLYTITGIAQNPPVNSSINFNVLISFCTKMINQELPRLSLFNGSHLFGLLCLTVIVGIAAESLPAFHLASLLPVKIPKNSFMSGHPKNNFRNGLVIFQFSVSILLIFCTIIIYRQQSFMKNKALGFNKENILIINLPTENLRAKNQILKNTLKSIPDITDVCLCSRIPYRGFDANGYRPEGFDSWKLMNIVFADENFLQTFDIQLLKGRNFDPEMATDNDAYLVNETLAAQLDWENPIDKTIERGGKHPIIGVVKDFHFATIHNKIDPMIISKKPEYGGFNFLALKVNRANISSTINIIKNEVSTIAPSAPFEYWFLDDAFDTLYRYEERVNQLFLCFSGLAIFIALLGLYSLVAISIEYKTKQVGIRKVLGSSIYGITHVFSKELLVPILLANLVAWPMGFYTANKWLEIFAYRIAVSWWIYVLSGFLTLVIALLTISFQTIKAASANPVEALRYE